MEVRWQLIRSFETSLVSQNENLELRKLVARARTERDALKVKNAETIKKVGLDFINQVHKLRDELVRLKKVHNDGLTEHDNYTTKLNQRVQELSSTVADEILARNNLDDDNNRLKVEIGRMEKELADVQAIKGTDAQRSAKTIEELREQLGEADTNNKVYLEKIEALETQVSNEILTRESLSEEVKRLRMWVGKMEEKGLMAAAEAEELKLKMESEHAMAIQALTEESNTLRGTIAFLQDELYRVQTALNVPPSNSHFGKFVELKSENRQLQSKLENTLRNQAAAPFPNAQDPASSSIISASSGKGQVKRAPVKGMKGNMLQSGAGPQQMSPRLSSQRAAHPPGREMRSSSGGQASRPKAVVLEAPGGKTVV